MSSGFGLSYFRGEGMPIHPDDSLWDLAYEMSDKFYYNQLKAYVKAYGIENTTALRQDILDRIKNEI